MYDVDISTNELVEAVSEMNGSICRLDEILSNMDIAMKEAKEGFDSANYYRAAYGTKKSTESVVAMQENLKEAQKYLNCLVEIIEEYNKISY